MRAIIEDSENCPLVGDSVVWVLDECHMLTKDAINALLKITEDTPEHLYFVFCTTAPDRILVALQNRATVLQVKEIPENELAILVRQVSRREGNPVTAEEAKSIAVRAKGSARKALVLLHGACGQEDLEPEAVPEAGGLALCRALMGGNWSQVIGILKDLDKMDCDGLRWFVLGYMAKVMATPQQAARGFATMEPFLEPFTDSGWPGFVAACYVATVVTRK